MFGSLHFPAVISGRGVAGRGGEGDSPYIWPYTLILPFLDVVVRIKGNVLNNNPGRCNMVLNAKILACKLAYKLIMCSLVLFVMQMAA